VQDHLPAPRCPNCGHVEFPEPSFCSMCGFKRSSCTRSLQNEVAEPSSKLAREGLGISMTELAGNTVGSDASTEVPSARETLQKLQDHLQLQKAPSVSPDQLHLQLQKTRAISESQLQFQPPEEVFRRKLFPSELSRVQEMLNPEAELELEQIAAREFQWALQSGGGVTSREGNNSSAERIDLSSALTALRQMSYLNGLPALDPEAARRCIDQGTHGVDLQTFAAALPKLLRTALRGHSLH